MLSQFLLQLGGGAEQFRTPFFKLYLPPGQMLKLSAKDFERDSANFLRLFNDAKNTNIISAVASSAQLPWCEPKAQRGVSFHFQLNTFAVGDADERQCFRYSSLGDVSLQPTASLPRRPRMVEPLVTQELCITVPSMDGSGKPSVIRLAICDVEIERLRSRGALEKFPRWRESQGDECSPGATRLTCTSSSASNVKVDANAKVTTGTSASKGASKPGKAASKGFRKATETAELQKALDEQEARRQASFEVARRQAQANAVRDDETSEASEASEASADEVAADHGADPFIIGTQVHSSDEEDAMGEDRDNDDCEDIDDDVRCIELATKRIVHS